MKDYNQQVAEYYNEDALSGFEERAEQNSVLDRIRNEFRATVQRYSFSKALEIGCGPGFDLEWFASTYPEKEIVGIDISHEMVKLAKQRIQRKGFNNVHLEVATDETMVLKFGEQSFDLVYVFFGALNTAKDLNRAAQQISTILKKDGIAVLTFVNKWYFREMFVQLMKLRIKSALARVRTVWGGYSVDRFLPSHCYSPKQIQKAFSSFTLLEKKGYSIFFPAWYNHHKIKGNTAKGEKLWKLDQKVQSTFLWSKGEYTLFVFKNTKN